MTQQTAETQAVATPLAGFIPSADRFGELRRKYPLAQGYRYQTRMASLPLVMHYLDGVPGPASLVMIAEIYGPAGQLLANSYAGNVIDGPLQIEATETSARGRLAHTLGYHWKGPDHVATFEDGHAYKRHLQVLAEYPPERGYSHVVRIEPSPVALTPAEGEVGTTLIATAELRDPSGNLVQNAHSAGIVGRVYQIEDLEASARARLASALGFGFNNGVAVESESSQAPTSPALKSVAGFKAVVAVVDANAPLAGLSARLTEFRKTAPPPAPAGDAVVDGEDSDESSESLLGPASVIVETAVESVVDDAVSDMPIDLDAGERESVAVTGIAESGTPNEGEVGTPQESIPAAVVQLIRQRAGIARRTIDWSAIEGPDQAIAFIQNLMQGGP
jgi:hypothetical protein